MQGIIISLLILTTAIGAALAYQAECNKPMDPGFGDEKKIRFFYDPKLKTCFEMIYKGNGGNLNRFDSLSLCLIACTLGVECDNECKCDNTHKSVEKKCNMDHDLPLGIACQAWYLRCPDYKNDKFPLKFPVRMSRLAQ